MCYHYIPQLQYHASISNIQESYQMANISNSHKKEWFSFLSSHLSCLWNFRPRADSLMNFKSNSRYRRTVWQSWSSASKLLGYRYTGCLLNWCNWIMSLHQFSEYMQSGIHNNKSHQSLKRANVSVVSTLICVWGTACYFNCMLFQLPVISMFFSCFISQISTCVLSQGRICTLVSCINCPAETLE